MRSSYFDRSKLIKWKIVSIFKQLRLALPYSIRIVNVSVSLFVLTTSLCGASLYNYPMHSLCLPLLLLASACRFQFFVFHFGFGSVQLDCVFVGHGVVGVLPFALR